MLIQILSFNCIVKEDIKYTIVVISRKVMLIKIYQIVLEQGNHQENDNVCILL